MIFAKGMPNSSLSLAASMRFSIFGNSSPNAPMRVNPRAAQGGEIRTEKIETGVGESTEVARLQGGARDDERAAERAFLAGLGVALIGHQLGAGSAHVTLNVLIEQRPCPRAEMRHHIF